MKKYLSLIGVLLVLVAFNLGAKAEAEVALCFTDFAAGDKF